MKRVDFSPLYRSSVGFDHLFRLMESMATNPGAANAFPPYDIEKTGETGYRISIAVAGFGPADLSVECAGSQLIVTGERKEVEGANSKAHESVAYLHRGIATRAFRRTFELADHVKVESSRLENGLLHIELVREVPEEAKPRRIEISASGPATLAARAKKLLGGAKEAA